MPKLDKNEKELLDSVENDEWVSAKDFETQKKEYETVARNTMLKNRRINIRLSEKDLDGIKIKAMEEGIPYQTLISSVIHKYLTGKLVSR